MDFNTDQISLIVFILSGTGSLILIGYRIYRMLTSKYFRFRDPETGKEVMFPVHGTNKDLQDFFNSLS